MEEDGRLPSKEMQPKRKEYQTARYDLAIALHNVPLLPRGDDACSPSGSCLGCRRGGRRTDGDLRKLLSEIGEKVIARLLRARPVERGRKDRVSLRSILKWCACSPTPSRTTAR